MPHLSGHTGGQSIRMAIKEETNAALPEINNVTISQTLVQRPAYNLYKGRQQKEQTPVFLFVLNQTRTENPELTTQFIQRAQIVAELDAPSLADVLASGLTREKRAFTAVARAAGPTLAEFLAQRPDEEAALPPVAALSLMQPVAAAMWVAEQAGLVHYNLTPESIILTQKNNSVLYDLTLPLGTSPSPPSPYPEKKLTYQAPEQLAGQPPTIPGNIYAFGIILYELLAGHRPKLPASEWDIFEHKGIPREIPLEEARPGLAPATYELVKNCIWQKEWSRYQSFSTLLAALEKALAAERESPPPPLPASLKRHILVVGGALLVVLLLLAGSFLAIRSAPGEGNGRVEQFTPTNTAAPAQTVPPPTVTKASRAENQPAEPAPAKAAPVEPTATKEATATTAATATATATPTPSHTPSPTASPTTPATSTPPETATPETASCVPSPPPGWVQYIVQEGDYLFNLAVATGRTVERIQEVNCLTGNLLRPNQQIWLPRLPATPTATPSPEPANTPGPSQPPAPTTPSQPPPPTNESPSRTPPPPP